MKKQFRIKKHPEFDLIIKTGRKIKTPNFTIAYLPSDEDFTRIGIAVGKSNGNAVKRVKAKRQVRAMLANYGDYTLPVNVIIVIRPSFAKGSFEENQKELHAALEQMRSPI